MMRRAAVLFCLALGPGCDDGPDRTATGFENCHRVQIIDAQTGAAVRGLEDMAVTANGAWALASAYDRWGTQDAVEENAALLPQGALYLIPLDAALLSKEKLTLTNIAQNFSSDRDFHPHGLDLFVGPEGKQTIAVINRTFEREDPESPWVPSTTLEAFALEGQELRHERTIASGLLCRANDVLALSGRQFLVSRDHGACGGLGAVLEDVFGLDRAEILRISVGGTKAAPPQIEIAAEGVAFANGLALDAKSGAVYVAATRGERISSYQLEDLLNLPKAAPLKSLQTDAGPDNLSWGQEGRLIAALHPSLWRLGFYRKRWLGVDRSPSLIVSIDPAAQTQTTLFFDPSGARFSAATIGIQTDDLLLIGGVVEPGVMVCVGATEPPQNEGT